MKYADKGVVLMSCRPSNSPVGTIRDVVAWRDKAVLPAFQFPSWYNRDYGSHNSKKVLPAFQFPSWYNYYPADYYCSYVLPAFQFPSWYN